MYDAEGRVPKAENTNGRLSLKIATAGMAIGFFCSVPAGYLCADEGGDSRSSRKKARWE